MKQVIVFLYTLFVFYTCLTERLKTEWCDCAGGLFLGSDLVTGHGAGEPVVEEAHLKVETDTH